MTTDFEWMPLPATPYALDPDQHGGAWVIDRTGAHVGRIWRTAPDRFGAAALSPRSGPPLHVRNDLRSVTAAGRWVWLCCRPVVWRVRMTGPHGDTVGIFTPRGALHHAHNGIAAAIACATKQARHSSDARRYVEQHTEQRVLSGPGTVPQYDSHAVPPYPEGGDDA